MVAALFLTGAPFVVSSRRRTSTRFLRGTEIALCCTGNMTGLIQIAKNSYSNWTKLHSLSSPQRTSILHGSSHWKFYFFYSIKILKKCHKVGIFHWGITLPKTVSQFDLIYKRSNKKKIFLRCKLTSTILVKRCTSDVGLIYRQN